MKFYEKILNFYATLNFDKTILPQSVDIMNPFFDGSSGIIKDTIREFYKKFYDDTEKRKMILGINPGRHGAGVTGITFTDTKRLNSECGIVCKDYSTHETSSVFVYDMINAYGGVQKFYKDLYITAVSPLGFIKLNNTGREINFNYYDDSKFKERIKPFVVSCIKKQLEFGINQTTCFCLGIGDNFDYLSKLNSEYNFFEKIIPLAHPRYIMQYKFKKKDYFISKYIEVFRE